MKNKNFKQEIKDWWNKYKSEIKTGFAVGMIGAFAGFAAGVNVTDKLWIDSLNQAANELNTRTTNDVIGAD